MSAHNKKKWLLLWVKLLTIPLVSLAVLAFLAGKITSASSRISGAQQNAAAFAKRYDSFDTLKKEWAGVSPHVETLERAIPAPENFPEIEGYIASVTDKTANVASTRFDPVPKPDDLSLEELSFTMDLTGTGTTLRQLLAELETAPYFIEVRAFTVSFTEGLNGQAKATLSGVVYLKEAVQ